MTTPTTDVDYTVRALWKQRGAPTTWTHYVTSCDTRARALHIAQNVREIFGCPTWIEEFNRPASLPLLKVRAEIAHWEATGEFAVDREGLRP